VVIVEVADVAGDQLNVYVLDYEIVYFCYVVAVDAVVDVDVTAFHDEIDDYLAVDDIAAVVVAVVVATFAVAVVVFLSAASVAVDASSVAAVGVVVVVVVAAADDAAPDNPSVAGDSVYSAPTDVVQTDPFPSVAGHLVAPSDEHVGHLVEYLVA